MKIRIFVLFLLLASCTHAGPKVESVSAEAVKFQPSDPLPRSLEAKIVSEEKLQPHFDFAWKDRNFRVAHGKWKEPRYNSSWNRMYGFGPTVWVTVEKETRVLDLRKELVSYYVAHVFHDEAGGKVFLFLDFGIEGPSPAYIVWISEDRGEHWFPGGELMRPPGEFPPAELSDFVLDAQGNGTAYFRQDVSNLSPELRKGSPATWDAIYLATTNDGGRSWKVDLQPRQFTVLRHEMGQVK